MMEKMHKEMEPKKLRLMGKRKGTMAKLKQAMPPKEMA